jgi:predicted nucleic acid-binding protein
LLINIFNNSQLAQTRHQQWEASEKARLPAGEYEKNAQKQEEVRKDALAALKKEERRYDMEKFYSYVIECLCVILFTNLIEIDYYVFCLFCL